MSGSEEDITGLINKFGLFTSNEAKFEKDENGLERYIDIRLTEKARRLFKALGFEKEVTLPL